MVSRSRMAPKVAACFVNPSSAALRFFVPYGLQVVHFLPDVFPSRSGTWYFSRVSSIFNTFASVNELHELNFARICLCFQLSLVLFDLTTNMNSIRYSLQGKVAGSAYRVSWVFIKFGLWLLSWLLLAPF